MAFGMGLIRGIALAIALAFSLGQAAAQDEEHGLTPFQIQRGEQIFLSNCANCHGPDGDAITGADLASGKFRHATTDRDLINIIQHGIPGTPMPPSNYPEAQAVMIVGYIHSMKEGATSGKSSLSGDPARGKAIFEARGECLNCHQAKGRGTSFLGPDLSDIGALRRSADLDRSLTDPSADIRPDNRTVRAVRKDGVTILGRLLNQDTYSLQILSSNGKLMSLSKSDLRQFEIMKMSPMPSYREKLSEQERADLLSYLTTLKGSGR